MLEKIDLSLHCCTLNQYRSLYTVQIYNYAWISHQVRDRVSAPALARKQPISD